MFKSTGHQPQYKVDWVHSCPGVLLCEDESQNVRGWKGPLWVI